MEIEIEVLWWTICIKWIHVCVCKVAFLGHLTEQAGTTFSSSSSFRREDDLLMIWMLVVMVVMLRLVKERIIVSKLIRCSNLAAVGSKL